MISSDGSYFLDVDYSQIYKNGQIVGGDLFYSKKYREQSRMVSVLSDGLGSGIKAGVLATLTATMAAGCVAGEIGIERTAQVIMQSLPVCRVRKISYATFTIVKSDSDGNMQVIEYDNPPAFLLRGNRPQPLQRQPLTVRQGDKQQKLYFSDFKISAGDRLLFCSDGVPQSGMGGGRMPFGWEWDNVCGWVVAQLEADGQLSSRRLAQAVVNRSLRNDAYTARDDITCAVISARTPRRLLLISGPPLKKERDAELAARALDFTGNVIIAGGTTANIVSRESGRPAEVDLKSFRGSLPPTATMPGIALVTEGILTLSKVIDIISRRATDKEKNDAQSGAVRIVGLLLASDQIEFLVGTKINEAHQDANVPVGLEIRRNLITQLADLLREKYLKEVTLNYI